MSRQPQQLYTYPSADYYYEETDGNYVGGYSEGESLSETPQHLLTRRPSASPEMYREKVVAVPSQQARFQQQRPPYYYAQE